MIIKFKGRWSAVWQAAINKIKKTKRKILILEVSEEDFNDVMSKLNKLNEFQVKKDELRELVVEIEYHYKKRTLDQNKLVHVLIGHIASVMNGRPLQGNQLKKASDHFYMQLMDDYARTVTYIGNKDDVAYVKSQFRLIKSITQIEENKFIVVAYRSTSHMTTIEVASIIDTLFDILMGMDLPEKVQVNISNHFSGWKTFNEGGEK